MIRDLAKVCGLFGALAISSCSLLLDWNGYTGGRGSSPSDAMAGGNDDASDDATLDVGGPADAKDARDSDDATGKIPDAPTGADAMQPGGPDGANMAPPCSLLNCGGCCTTVSSLDAGVVVSMSFCAGGAAPDTCGKGGAMCQDCTKQTFTCDSNRCAQPPPQPEGGTDAGTQPACTLSFCSSLHACMPVWQDACCRSDNFCGCQIKTPPGITVPGTCI